MIERFVLGLLLALLPACGCGHLHASPDGSAMAVDIKACATGAVPGGVAALVDQTIESLLNAPGAPTWQQFSQSTLVAEGVQVGQCALEAAWHDLHITLGVVRPGQVSPQYVEAEMRYQAWLSEHHLKPAQRP